jgi:hypothetical protein
MPTEKELLEKFIGKTLNIPAEEVATLMFEKVDDKEVIKADALESLLEKDKARIAKFVEDRKTQFDNGYKKAQAETLSKFEKEIKEKFGVAEDKQGLELIESIVAENIKGQGGELDEEKIKRSKLYLDTVSKLNKEKEEAIAAEAKKFNDLETSIKKQTIFKTISDKAKEKLKELNPILPEGKTNDGKSKSDIQIERFLRELEMEYNFELKDDKILISDKEGKLLETPQHYPVDFNELVKEKASALWDFKQGEDRSGTGNKNNGNQGGSDDGGKGGYKGPLPKNEDEYLKLVSELKDESQQIALTEEWVKSQQKV